jgi:cyclase
MRGFWRAAWVVGILLGVGRGWGQAAAPLVAAPGVWFLLGDASKGYINTVVIEMKSYLIVVDANYPGRAKELLVEIPKLSPKPVRYVFDTHQHGDHAYGNSVWTKAGATTLAYVGVTEEMNRYEPERWRAAEAKREDVRALGEADVERPKQTFRGDEYVLQDGEREVRFLHLGWGHTRGDGFVWLPKERVLCTGDAAVNGARNKLWDANLAEWPRVLDKAIALGPEQVLPGHGDAGGAEILRGQRLFLVDLVAAVTRQRDAGVPLDRMAMVLPARDEHWVPKSLEQDFGIVDAELAAGRPAGSLPHEWK